MHSKITGQNKIFNNGIRLAAARTLLFMASALTSYANANLMPNPGAEEVILFKGYPKEAKPGGNPKIAEYVPKGWGLYVGSPCEDPCEWGATDKEAHTGKHSCFLTFNHFHENKDGEKSVNLSLNLGGSNGYTAGNAIKSEGGEDYHFSFWAKGNIPRISVKISCWTAGNADPIHQQNIDATLASNWTKFEGRFSPAPNAERFLVRLQISAVPGLSPGQAIYVDDVEIKKMPKAVKMDDGSPFPVKVAIYEDEKNKDSGRKFIHDALLNEKGIKAQMIDTLADETLKKYDVLILSAIQALSEKDARSDDLNRKGVDYAGSILHFVNSGKGVILGHDCVGYRHLFGATKLFPSICVGNGRIVGKEKLNIVGKSHPVTKDVPETFSHSYSDHLTLLPGVKATVLAKDKEDNPVIVAGELSRGRVVAIGYPMGIWTKPGESDGDYSAPLPAEEKVVLVNAVRWAGGNPKYDVPQEETRCTLLAEAEQYARQMREADLARWRDLPDPHFSEAYMWFFPSFWGPPAHDKTSGFCLNLYTEAKIVKAIEDCKKMGFTGIIAEAKGRYFLYPSKLYPDEERLPGGFDFAGIIGREAKKRGMKVGFHMAPFFSSGDWKNHPPCLTRKEAEEIKNSGGNMTTGKTKMLWSCPDHPSVREKALKVTAEIIEKYHPDLINLDFERYSEGYDTSCFCDYSMKRKSEYARNHPELSPREVDGKFSKESIGGFVREWVDLCKKLEPKIKTAAYTMSGDGAPQWVYKFPVDYHEKYVSSRMSGPGSALEDVAETAEKYSKMMGKNNPDGNLLPIISAYDYKPPERTVSEFKVLSHALDRLKKEKVVIYYSYDYLIVDRDYNIDEGVAKAISKALGGNWK
ncbi:MAG: family 10 glycosylhydrolase [Verrucomicrobiae bacterium]|nr:family 10 glycosylhydrolase [Verrucomicrobiae bacterium]